MSNTGTLLPELISVDGTRSPRPVQGYTVLSAAKIVRDRHVLQYTVSEHDNGFIVGLRLKGVDVELAAENSEVIATEQFYRHISLSARLTEKVAESDARAAMALLADYLQRTIADQRNAPVPELRSRICLLGHHGARVSTLFDRELQLWFCPYSDHGLLNEEDTREVRANPFER